MNRKRLAAVTAVGFGVLALALMGFSISDDQEYYLEFANAGQLVKDDDVQIGGRRIGSVRSIDLTKDNKARIKISVAKRYAPLRQGTRAVIRLTSLSGVANRYIALTVPPENNKPLPEGAVLNEKSTTSVVDLDELFNTFDPRTRRNLQRVIHAFATQYAGAKTQERARATFAYLNPAFSSARRLSSELSADEPALSAFLVNSAATVTALAERRSELSQLIGNANSTAIALSDENQAIQRSLAVLPTTLRQANTTFVNLRSTLSDLDHLVSAAKPATKDLAPFLRELRPLIAAARPTIHDLRRALSDPRTNLGLLGATRGFPALQKTATPAFENSVAALRKAQPVFEFIRPYTPDLVGWFRDFGQGTAAYDANGHYARVQPTFNAFSFVDSATGGTLMPQDPSRRLDGMEHRVLRRCPGNATQTPPGMSRPSSEPADCENSPPPGP